MVGKRLQPVVCLGDLGVSAASASAPATVAGLSGPPMLFDLASVVEHVGGPPGAHCTAVLMSPLGGCTRVSDSVRKPVTGKDMEGVQTYMALYVRRSEPPHRPSPELSSTQTGADFCAGMTTCLPGEESIAAATGAALPDPAYPETHAVAAAISPLCTAKDLAASFPRLVSLVVALLPSISHCGDDISRDYTYVYTYVFQPTVCLIMMLADQV